MERINASERVGSTINNLKILDWKREGNRTYFFTECLLCGKRTWIRSDLVISGNTTNCGNHKSVDLKGMKFGKLTAIEPTSKRENRKVIWKCQCSCENKTIVYVSTRNLLAGNIVSCGCVKKENALKTVDELETYSKMYRIDGTDVRLLGSKIAKNNTSGCKGVSWKKKQNIWVATITFKGKRYYLGGYHKKEDAIDARKRAEENIFDEFLKWYQENYTDFWNKLTKSKKREC